MHEGHRERVREKYMKYGIDSLSPHEVLELLLFYSITRGDTNKTAHNLLDAFGGNITNVFDADVRDLCAVEGIGTQSAVLIKIVAELWSYYHRSKWQGAIYLSNSTEVGEYAYSVLANIPYEFFYIMCFDARKRLIVMQKVEEGSVANVGISTRKAVECALRNRAHSVAFSHNHPAGSLHPSEEDIYVTEKLCAAFDAIEIPVIDHIIVAGKGYTSMAERGLMP